MAACGASGWEWAAAAQGRFVFASLCRAAAGNRSRGEVAAVEVVNE